MPDRDAFAERGRSLEEDYFRKRDRELIEKIRQAAAAEEIRKDLGHKTGLDAPELLQELHDLGFTPERSVCCRSCRSFRWRGSRVASRRRSAS